MNASSLDSITLNCINKVNIDNSLNENKNLNNLLIDVINNSKYDNNLKTNMLVNRQKYENLLSKYIYLKAKFFDECLNVRCLRISDFWDILENIKINTKDFELKYNDNVGKDDSDDEDKTDDGIMSIPQEYNCNDNIKELLYKKLALEQDLIIKYKKLKKIYKEQIKFDQNNGDENDYDFEDLNVHTFSDSDDNEYNEREDFEEDAQMLHFAEYHSNNIVKIQENKNFYKAMKMIYSASHPHLIDHDVLILTNKYKYLCKTNIILREDQLFNELIKKKVKFDN